MLKIDPMELEKYQLLFGENQLLTRVERTAKDPN